MKCINCGKYPFCNKIENSQQKTCEDFIKRKLGNDIKHYNKREKMKIKFIDIGSRKANFIKECKNELTYDWLLKAVKPFLYSHNIDFEIGIDNKIYVFAGMQTVGTIEILKN